MQRREFLKAAALGTAALAWPGARRALGEAAAPAGGSGSKPNIIFILSDDVGLGNLSCYGGAFKTPKLDQLAQGGIKFETCFAEPLCGPSRCELMTGRYAFRTGMISNQSGGVLKPENEIMIPKILKPAGYVTAQVGKWNQLPLEPGDWGYDEYLRFQGSGKYWDVPYTLNGERKRLPAGKYLPDVMHEFLVDFITRHKEQPFFVYYSMSHIHGKIMQTPDSKPEAGRGAWYADNIAYMDKLVGKLVDELARLGLRERTLLVFVGDNGTAPGSADQATVNGKRLSGQKGTMLEGGSRVPMIANWPGTTPAGKTNADLIDFSDFMPTFATLAGAPLPAGVKIDGHSFAPQLKGEAGTPREWVYVELNHKWYVRSKEWKLTGSGELYDVKNAPFEEKPVPADTTDPAAVAARKRLQAVLDELNPAAGKQSGPGQRQKGGKKAARAGKKAQRAQEGGAKGKKAGRRAGRKKKAGEPV